MSTEGNGLGLILTALEFPMFVNVAYFPIFLHPWKFILKHINEKVDVPYHGQVILTHSVLLHTGMIFMKFPQSRTVL